MSVWTKTVCDVCRLIDGDLSLKACFYCSLCDSWICQYDEHDWGRRAHAKVLRTWEKTRGLFA